MSESQQTFDEIENSKVIRPELFHTPQVSGIAVPICTSVGGTAVTRLALYLRWKDGKREERILDDDWLDLADGTRLWFHPKPISLWPGTFPSWSVKARRQWKEGALAPDPTHVFRRICASITNLIEFPADQAAGIIATLALWVMLTYVYPAWDAVPYLYLGGPKESGKSRLMQALARLVFRPMQTDNPSAAYIFRTLHAQGGVLLFDEAEQLRQSTPDVQAVSSMLLAGYKRGGRATRMERDGDNYRSASFEVYGPKVLACIRGLTPVLASRCISVMMFRAAPGSLRPRRRIDARPERWQRIRDDLHAITLEYGPVWLELAQRADVCPDAITNRGYELWQPILALATWLESLGADGLVAVVEDCAKATIADAHDELIPPADEMLLREVADAVRNGTQGTLTAAKVLALAQCADPATFGRAIQPNPLWTPSRVGMVLKRYGIKSTPGRQRTYRDVTPEQMRQIQCSYGVDLGIPTLEEPSTPSTPSLARTA